jgi:hypothetical protein
MTAFGRKPTSVTPLLALEQVQKALGDTKGLTVLGLLRTPAGINPFATEFCVLTAWRLGLRAFYECFALKREQASSPREFEPLSGALAVCVC